MPTYEVNNASKITIYKQITDTSCAATCAAMCVRKSPQTLQAAGFDLGYADWTGIAQRYGYDDFNKVDIGETEAESLLKIVDLIVEGYPVIAKISPDSAPHWVVVTTYSGDTANLGANQFTCADPWTGKFIRLSRATRYKGIYVIRYLYPQSK